MGKQVVDISGGGRVLPKVSSSDQKARLTESAAGIASRFARSKTIPMGGAPTTPEPARVREPETVEEALTLADLRDGKRPAKKKRKPVVTEDDDGGFHASEVIQRTGGSGKPRSGASMAAGALGKMKIHKRT